MTQHTVQFYAEDKVGFLILNRPDKRNALNYQLVAECKALLNDNRNNPDIRVIVIKGAGEVFCAGADLEVLKSLQTNTYKENLADSTHLAELFDLIYRYPKPVIAQVHGAAIAGGCGLANVCDVAFATTESKLGFTEVNIGFIPAIVSIFLTRKISESHARELLLSGRIIDATEAYRMGLVHYLCPPEELQDAVNQYAKNLAKRTSPSSQQLTKELLAGVPDLALPEALAWTAELNAKARATSDCQKGINAFLNKEKLTW